MKILLTGEPGVGKSTIVESVIKTFPGKVLGVVARELRSPEGERVGFEAINFSDDHRTFAHKYDIHSELVVGGKYFVDLDAIEKFVVPELQQGMETSDGFIAIDEIGRMQAFSALFLKVVEEIFQADASFLGTIVHDPEPWSLAFKSHPEVILIEVTASNREELPNLLRLIFSQGSVVAALNTAQQAWMLQKIKDYFSQGKYIQIEKFFRNALPYLLEGRVMKESEELYGVQGNTDLHQVRFQENRIYTCDCPLFLGKAPYEGQAGECSHIQSVQLLRLS